MRKKSIKNVHISDQVEGACQHFSAMMEHYGVEGTVFAKIKGEKFLFAFTKGESPAKLKALLTSSSKMSARGAKHILDNGP